MALTAAELRAVATELTRSAAARQIQVDALRKQGHFEKTANAMQEDVERILNLHDRVELEWLLASTAEEGA